MKVLVCGGRDYSDSKRVASVLSKLKITCLINGGARGADKLSSRWAKVNNIPYFEYPADWDKFGKKAGPIRNQEMLYENVDIGFAVAFPGGHGTLNMISLLAEVGIFIFIANAGEWDVDILKQIAKIKAESGC